MKLFNYRQALLDKVNSKNNVSAQYSLGNATNEILASFVYPLVCDSGSSEANVYIGAFHFLVIILVTAST